MKTKNTGENKPEKNVSHEYLLCTGKELFISWNTVRSQDKKDCLIKNASKAYIALHIDLLFEKEELFFIVFICWMLFKSNLKKCTYITFAWIFEQIKERYAILYWIYTVLKY